LSPTVTVDLETETLESLNFPSFFAACAEGVIANARIAAPTTARGSADLWMRSLPRDDVRRLSAP
jgi:hypothetical protein